MPANQRPMDFSSPTRDTPAATAPLPVLTGIKKLGFDTETTAEPFLFDRTLRGLSYYLPDGRKGYIPTSHPGGGNYDHDAVMRWCKGELIGKELVVFNSKHEHHTMKKAGVDLEALGVTFMDVAHQAALVNEKRYKLNLDIVADEALNGYKMIEVDHSQLCNMPAEHVAPIAIEDAEVTWKAHQYYEPLVEADELGDALQLENEIVYSTCEMERNGSYIDVPLLLQYEREIAAELEKRLLSIYRETGLRINPQAPDDLIKLFRHLGIENPHKTDKGKDSFKKDILLEFYEAHPLIPEVIETRQLASLYSKYIKNYIASVQHDGRIYYSLHQLRSEEGGTITGRYSSSAMFDDDGGGINIQQVAKTKKMAKICKRWPIRRLFIAPDGEQVLSSDASQIEYRLFAHYASLCKHPHTGELMTRLAEQYRKDPTTDFHNQVVEWTGIIRDFAKNVNFCKLYGGGVDKVMLTINTSNKLNRLPLVKRPQVADVVAKYDKKFFEAKVLMKMAENRAQYKGFVHTLSGRRRRYDEGDKFYSALNAIFQGGAADIAKKKVNRLYKERKTLELAIRSQVHDEINGTIKDPTKKAMIEEVMMIQEYPLNVPILWETGVAANWEEAH